MKCINKFLPVLLAVCLLTGCGRSLPFPYSENKTDVSYRLFAKTSGNSDIAQSYASSLCVVDETDSFGTPIESQALSLGLFDLSRIHTIYAENVYAQVYPASLTKVMTALIALKYSTPETVLTASSNIYNLEAGAQTCGLAAGDTMTVDQALRLLLIYSANDVAIMIAENIGGSVEGFLSMMNTEATRIGATGTNFINSSGLNDSEHYSTAYDLYLIFQEAMKYDLFSEIINMSSYSTVYHDLSGGEKQIEVNSTDWYLRGEVAAPSDVTVIGGKTGTTNAAGHCLILLSRDVSGKPYISVVMGASDNRTLYESMNSLLQRIPN